MVDAAAETDQATLGRHVLVVDDNADLAETYQELLQAHGYRVTTAGNGALALEFIHDATINAVLCDLSMPELEGNRFYDTARTLRPELNRRFIFVTGNVGNPKYETFLRKVDVPVLYKPVSVANLLKALEELYARPS